MFRHEFLQIGNVEIFLGSLTIASACNKVLCRKFFNMDTIGLIPTAGYTFNNKYSKKAMMWLLHIEKTDGVEIKHSRNRPSTGCPNYPTTTWTVIVRRPNGVRVLWLCLARAPFSVVL